MHLGGETGMKAENGHSGQWMVGEGGQPPALKAERLTQLRFPEDDSSREFLQVHPQLGGAVNNKGVWFCFHPKE